VDVREEKGRANEIAILMIKIVWTKHAEIRQHAWEQKLGITKEEVENAVQNPEQTVPGDLTILVAQSRTRGGLLRVPFFESTEERRIITVYWTRKVEKYWKG